MTSRINLFLKKLWVWITKIYRDFD